MAGVDVEGGSRGGRRSLDSQINMIPMIDLLMVTISFLLITAVWTQLARVDVDAQVPGRSGDDAPPAPEKQLHVEMRSPDRFLLLWKQGQTTLESIDVPRREIAAMDHEAATVRFPDLAEAVEREWKAKGQHTGPGDTRRDVAVLHAENTAEFRDMVGVMDAVRAVHRLMHVGSKTESVPAFDMAFSVD